MAKKYLNGWQSPRFIVELEGTTTKIIDLNLRFQAFIESVEENYIEHELLDGTIVEKFLNARYYWDLNYSALAEASELLKIKAILNYLQMGKKIKLYPHKEVSDRWFYVVIVKDRLSLGRHYGGAIAPGEKDFSISFKSKYPMNSAGGSINWAEISDNGLPTRDILNQYYYMTDEAGNYITGEDGEILIVSKHEVVDYDEF